MPFKSQKQKKLCYSLMRRKKNKSWRLQEVGETHEEEKATEESKPVSEITEEEVKKKLKL